MSFTVKNIWQMIKLNNNQGPWGQWQGSNDNDPQKPKSRPTGNQGKKLDKDIDDQIDEMMQKGQEFLKNFFSKGGGNGGDNKNNGKNPNNSGNGSGKSIFGLILMGLAVLWLSSGVYKINSDENGLVLYFGKFASVSTPGLNYHLPAPFGKVIKKSVTQVNTEEFGFSSGSNSTRNSFSNSFSGRAQNISASKGDNLMLTGDENIVDIDFQIQWQISDIKDFIFNLEDPELAIKKSADSSMREIIARTPIADALSDGKRRIEQEAKILLQQMLDSYGAGVKVVLVQMRRVDPPSQVIDAFRDVQTAKADKEREINQAEAYSNDIIPRAKGEAAQITEKANAYKEEVVADAEGQAQRFEKIYNQYVRARRVTRKRMYLENMEKIYADIDKIIVDKNISKTGAVPFLPLNNLKNK